MSSEIVTADLSDRLRERMSALAASVSIVSAHGAQGPSAITVTSVTSVALEPPGLLVCINRRSKLLAAIEESGAFRVNYLAAGQSALANTFGRSGHGHVFSSVDWDLEAGCGPGVRGALAQMGCRQVARNDYGSHAVLIGAVEDVSGETIDPLVYVRRQYGRAVPVTDDDCRGN